MQARTHNSLSLSLREEEMQLMELEEAVVGRTFLLEKGEEVLEEVDGDEGRV